MNNVNCRRDIAELHYCWKQRKTLKIPPTSTHTRTIQTNTSFARQAETD